MAGLRRNSPTEGPVPDGEKKGHEPSSSSGRSWLYSATQTAFMTMRYLLTKEEQISLQEASIAALTREADRRVQSATFSHGVEVDLRIQGGSLSQRE